MARNRNIQSKYQAQYNAQNALSADGNIVIIGYSAGADSALILAAENIDRVVGLVMLGPTFTGATQADGSGDLKQEAPTMIAQLVNEGVKVILVDDNGSLGFDANTFGEGSSYTYIAPTSSRLHYGENGTNSSSSLYNSVWTDLMNP